MKTCTIRDLRKHAEALIHNAETGELSLVTKHGRPVFVALPFSEDMCKLGVASAFAIKLYQDGALTLGKAAKLANCPLELFIEMLGSLGVPIVNYSPSEVSKELKDFE